MAIKTTQLFCRRACFKKDFYRRNKSRMDEAAKRLPQYSCPVCGESTPLLFDPIKSPALLGNFVCPHCGIPRSVIFDFHDSFTFVIGNSMTAQFVIQSAIISS